MPREINYSVKLQICRFKSSPSFNIILKEKYCISARREGRFLGLLSTILAQFTVLECLKESFNVFQKEKYNLKSLGMASLNSEVIRAGSAFLSQQHLHVFLYCSFSLQCMANYNMHTVML